MAEASWRRARVAWLGVVGCVLAGMPALGAQPARALTTRDARVWAAVLAANDARTADSSIVDSALSSPHSALRAAGARLIGANRIAARFAAARALLTDRDTAVARDAAFALGLAVDTASCAPLRTALATTHAGEAAAWAIGDIAAVCGPFADQMARARHASVRAALLRVAVKWIPFPDSVVSAAYRGATSHDERWAALWAFGRAKHLGASALAFEATGDASAAIREMAARMLATRLPDPADSASALRQLLPLTEDVHPHVRIAALRSLTAYGAVVVPALTAHWRRETDVNVRVAIAQAVGALPADASPPWQEWWQSDTNFMVRRSLVASAWQAGAITSLGTGVADSLTTHPDFRLRIAMIEGAAARSADSNASTIAARRYDTDPRVRAAVLTALAAASRALRDSFDWAGMLSSAMQDDDSGVRRSAMSAITRAAGAPDIPAAVAAWHRVTRDSIAATRGTVRATPDTYERVVRTIIVPTVRGTPPHLVIETRRGPIRIVLDGVQAPMTADHLSTLARRGYFRSLRFHRVVPAFVAQGGDPRGDGSGGPGMSIRDELNRTRYRRAAVGMALAGPDTGGSQFFLTLSPQPHLDGHYSVFGRVISGFDHMDALVQGDAIHNITPQPE